MLRWGVAPRRPPFVERSSTVSQRTYSGRNLKFISSSRPLSFPSNSIFFRGCRGLQASPPRGTNFKISKNQGFTSPYTLPLEPFRYGFRCSRFFHEDQGFRRLFFKKFLQRAPTIGRGKFLDPAGAEGKNRRVHWSGKSGDLSLYRKKAGGNVGMCIRL